MGDRVQFREHIGKFVKKRIVAQDHRVMAHGIESQSHRLRFTVGSAEIGPAGTNDHCRSFQLILEFP